MTCPRTGETGHECTVCCQTYGFHSFRYSHARFNYANPELQQQMGHAYAGTTDHYRRWGERQLAEYRAYLPAGMDGGKVDGEQREFNGKDDGKPVLRLVSA